MASKGQPLGIGLAVDFASLDSDLARVADKIESVGKTVSLKVGSLAGLAAKGDIGGDKLAEQVSRIGIQLSAGMASGVRASSALLLSFGARINSMLDRLAGTAITLFDRIDAAMKFPMWDATFSHMHATLKNFWSGGKKGLSDFDLAVTGGFGKIAQSAAKILKPLFDNLGKTVADSVTKAMTEALAKVQEMADRMVQTMDNTGRAIGRSMNKAIDEISDKLRGMPTTFKAAGEADATALMTGFMSKTGKLYTGGGPTKRKGRVSEAGIARSVGKFTPEMREELLAPPPQPQQFVPARPAPRMGSEFMDIMAGAGAKMAKMFEPARASFKVFLEELKKGKDPLEAMASSFGTVGRTTAIALGVTEKFNVILGRTVAFGIDMGVVLAKSYMKASNFLSSFGSLHKKTYHELFEQHNIFVGLVLGSTKTLQHLFRGLVDIVTLRAFRRVGEDAGVFGKSVGVATGALKRMTGSVIRLGFEIAAAFGLIGVVFKIAEFFKKGTKSAADLNAEVSRSSVVFGASFGEVEKQAESLSKTFKISKASQLELASGFGSMAQGAGLSEMASAGLANQLTKLAVDMTGLGIPFDEVSEAMKTGLSGRAISLRQFGVAIDEDTTKAYAWSKGIAQVGQDLTKQQTLMARAGMIMQGLGYAQGSLADNSNKAAVQFQMAGGGIALFAEKIGELLMPAVQTATTGFNVFLEAVLDLVDRNLPVIKDWGAKVAGIFKYIGIVVRNWSDIWKIAKLAVSDFVTNVGKYLETIGPDFGIILAWVGRNWKNMFVDMLVMAKRTFTLLISNASNFAQALSDAIKGRGWHFTFAELENEFKATTEKFPELIKPALVSSDKEISALWKKIKKKEEELEKNRPGAGPRPTKTPLPELADQKAKEYHLSGALEMGSKEAFSAISRGLAGGHKVGTDQLSVAKQSLGVQKSILGALTVSPIGGVGVGASPMLSAVGAMPGAGGSRWTGATKKFSRSSRSIAEAKRLKALEEKGKEPQSKMSFEEFVHGGATATPVKPARSVHHPHSATRLRYERYQKREAELKKTQQMDFEGYYKATGGSGIAAPAVPKEPTAPTKPTSALPPISAGVEDKEVAAEMEKIAKELGYTHGELSQRAGRLAERARGMKIPEGAPASPLAKTSGKDYTTADTMKKYMSVAERQLEEQKATRSILEKMGASFGTTIQVK